MTNFFVTSICSGSSQLAFFKMATEIDHHPQFHHHDRPGETETNRIDLMYDLLSVVQSMMTGTATVTRSQTLQENSASVWNIEAANVNLAVTLRCGQDADEVGSDEARNDSCFDVASGNLWLTTATGDLELSFFELHEVECLEMSVGEIFCQHVGDLNEGSADSYVSCFSYADKEDDLGNTCFNSDTSENLSEKMTTEYPLTITPKVEPPDTDGSAPSSPRSAQPPSTLTENDTSLFDIADLRTLKNETGVHDMLDLSNELPVPTGDLCDIVKCEFGNSPADDDLASRASETDEAPSEMQEVKCEIEFKKCCVMLHELDADYLDRYARKDAGSPDPVGREDSIGGVGSAPMANSRDQQLPETTSSSTCFQPTGESDSGYRLQDSGLEKADLEAAKTHKEPQSKEGSSDSCRTNFKLSKSKQQNGMFSIGQEPHKCLYCGRSYAVKRSLRRHLKSHARERRHQCLYCTKSFATFNGLKEHLKLHGVKLRRNEERRVKNRNLIGYKPKRPEARAVQIEARQRLEAAKKSAQSKKRLKCSCCAKTFGRIDHLRHHEAAAHPRPKAYQCSLCGTCFTAKKNLQRHFRLHSEDTPFRCLCCGKSFTRKLTLMRHSRLHTAGGRYQCLQCGKSFGLSGNLRKHMMTHAKRGNAKGAKEGSVLKRTHSGKCKAEESPKKAVGGKTESAPKQCKKELPCSYCAKVFYRSDLLKRHRMIHTGERPHKCSHCGKGFIDKWKLGRHEMTHA